MRAPGIALPAAALAAALMAGAPLPPAAAQEARKAQSAAAVQRVPVSVVPAGRRVMERWLAAVGTVESLAAPRVAAEAPGRIVEIAAREGEAVRRGQLLARIDDTDQLLARDLAQAEIASLEALLEAARLRLRRVSALVEDNHAPRAALDEARAQRDSLRARLRGARTRLRQALRALKKTRVTSPLAGRLERRLVSVGDLVDIGTPLFRLSTGGRLRVRLPVPERELALVRRGQVVRLSSPAAPGGNIEARVVAILPRIDPASRSATVLVDITAAPGWRPGASVDGRILVARHKGATVVPERAVVLRPRGTVVFLPGDDGRAHARAVRTGLRAAGLVEILAGLKPGEKVIADGAGFLSDGAAVEVREP